jgi:hypothetical protein
LIIQSLNIFIYKVEAIIIFRESFISLITFKNRDLITNFLFVEEIKLI